MCGIFGIAVREGMVSREVLERARQCLAHRGPDDSGSVIIDVNSPGLSQLGLVHTRLSIIDLSPLGHQPMQDPVTGSWTVFNGEIYNFRDLRRELESAGEVFRSQSDTEVVLAAYRMWGEECLTRLRGMFAFALWDAPQKRLLLARDPMGIKPLYFCQTASGFAFASEVRILLRTGVAPGKLDATGVWSFLEFGSACEPWTIVEGVTAVPPAHVVTVERGTIKSREYWNPLRSASALNTGNGDRSAHASANTPRAVAATVREAVISHMVSDVPVGVFLSGGVDSSSLVAVLSAAGVRASTFSLVFREEEFNEAQYSREVARQFGTDHHEIPVAHDDVLAALPDALAAMDQPTIDGINTYLVSAKTRAAGVKVALTGLGADEMFAGYSNFHRVPKMERFLRRFGRLPRFARRPLAASVARLGRRGDRNRKLAELAASDGSISHPYFLARMLFGMEERRQLFGSGHFEQAQRNLDRALGESVAETESLDPINRVSWLESRWYMRNTLLRDSDFMSMAHGLELRVPFLDRPLVEACLEIPGAKKLGKSPKPMLLASLGVELPIRVVNRPKRGFTLPFEHWLRHEMRPVIEKTLLSADPRPARLSAGAVRDVWSRFLAGETSWSRPWALFVLDRWCSANL